MKKSKIVLMKFLFILLSGYAIFAILNQQKALNQYDKNKQELLAQIKEQEEYKEELSEKKENVNSLEFIEQTAREYLDMHLPNEKVFIDQGR